VHSIEIVILLVAVVLGVASVSNRLSAPYPILLVIVGLVLAAIPGLPEIRIEPDLVFLVFLPPILWAAAYFTSFRDFRANARPILLLAVGLVLATTAAVACVAHALLPGLGWAAAAALGAIVSPPDAVSATAIAGRLGLPRRVVTILEGESLVNDAMALVLYHAAVAAVVAGSFSFGSAVGELLLATSLGVGIGLAVGALACAAARITEDSFADIAITLLAPYVAWVLAERFHGSGVLACVAGGLYSRRHLDAFLAPLTRLQAHSVWTMLVYLLNGVIFVLIGLQLRPMQHAIPPGDLGPLLLCAAAVLGVVIGLRLCWVPLLAWLPRVVSASLRTRDPMPPRAAIALIGWIGMRGIVTIAAALALPFTTATGDPLPFRGELVLLSFGVVLGTLLLQGLSLPWLVPRLHLPVDRLHVQEELKARTQAVTMALRRLGELAQEPWARAHHVDQLRVSYEARLERILLLGEDADLVRDEELALHRLHEEILRTARQAVVQLRDQGVVGDEVTFKLERELDLELVRLGVLKGPE
jgi:CPA1 family monovalent cation:H+ antiporter